MQNGPCHPYVAVKSCQIRRHVVAIYLTRVGYPRHGKNIHLHLIIEPQRHHQAKACIWTSAHPSF